MTSPQYPSWPSSAPPASGPVTPPPAPPPHVVDAHTLGQWLVATCTMYGAAPSTGYKVAGQFLEGLEDKDGK